MSHDRATLSDYRWLVEGEGREWLDRCQTDSSPTDQLVRRLRRHLSAVRTHLVLEQLELRRRAAARFESASRLYFTPRALQQATDERLACYKAARIAVDTPVVDLGCGIGGDLFALARRGPSLGVDLDPVLAYLAAANLRLLGLTNAHAAAGDARELSVLPEAAVHLDPDRRPGERRSVTIDFHQPGPELIERLARHPAGLALKLAPATEATDERLRDAELEWLGSRRECQQLVAWFGPLARCQGRRVATFLAGDGTAHSLAADEIPRLRLTANIGRFILEPVPCVLAAGLAAVVAAQQQLESLTPRGGYLTGDRMTASPWTQGFEVLAIMPLRPRRLKAWLAEHNVGRLEIKQRGVAVDPRPLVRQCRANGSESATVILLRQGAGKKVLAVVTRRLPGAIEVGNSGSNAAG